MTRTDKFFYNALSSLIYQIAHLLSGIIIPRVMLSAYGSEINGLVSSISQFVSYFALVEAGLAAASVFALYKPLANGDNQRISEVVCESRDLYYKSGYIFGTLLMLLAVIYPFIVGPLALSRLQMALLVIALGGATVINFFITAKYRVIITADQKNYILNFLHTVYIFLYTVAVVVLTKLNVNIVLLRYISLIIILITPIYLHFYMKKRYKEVNYRAKYKKGAIKQRWDALILQLLGTVHTSFPVVIATIFTSLKEVSVYSIYNMVVLGIQQMMGVFGTGLSASFGELLAKKEYQTFKKAYEQYELMTYIIITVALSCTMVLIQPFVDIYTAGVTDANYHRPLIGFLFVLNAVCFCIKNPQGSLVSSAGLFKDTKKQTIIQTSIAVVLGLLLVKPFGIAGILIGRILSNVYRDIDLIIYIPRKIGHISIRKSFKRVSLIFVQMIVICLPFVFMKISANSFMEWVIKAIFVFAYSLVVCVVFNMLLDRKTFNELLSRLTTVLKKRVKKNG